MLGPDLWSKVATRTRKRHILIVQDSDTCVPVALASVGPQVATNQLLYFPRRNLGDDFEWNEVQLSQPSESPIQGREAEGCEWRNPGPLRMTITLGK